MLKRAMELAQARGMRLSPVSDDLADIFCATCGWPLDHRVTVVAQYVREPYGCVWCGGDDDQG